MHTPTNCSIRHCGNVVFCAVAAVCLACLGGCGKPQPAVHAMPAASQPSGSLEGSPFDPNQVPKYTLYPGDLLLVRYPTDSSLDQQVRIRSDGMISLPYVGDVQAAQCAPADLATDLNKKYEGVLKKADVAVIVVEETGRRVYLGGQVRSPGALALRPHQTLTQALFEVGGTTTFAHRSQTIVIRDRPGEARYVLKADLTRILAGTEPDVRLEPFDLIYVPETAITRVDQFVDQYINQIIPRAVVTPFTFQTELHNEPVRVIDNSKGQGVVATPTGRGS